jgi:hypothetical protein
MKKILHKPQIRKRHIGIPIIVLAILAVTFYGLGKTSQTYNLKLSDSTSQALSNQPAVGSATVPMTLPPTADPSAPPNASSVGSNDTTPVTTTPTPTPPVAPTLVSTTTCYAPLSSNPNGLQAYGQFTINTYSDGSTQITALTPSPNLLQSSGLPLNGVLCPNNQIPTNQLTSN